MAKFELKLPKMGESVAEATVTNWLKNIGDTIEADEPVLEIATDKVDSEVPSEVDGVLVEILFNTDDVVQVGQTMAIIETNIDVVGETPQTAPQTAPQETESVKQVASTVTAAKDTIDAAVVVSSTQGRFYSPLVKKMAQKENISQEELDTVLGTGKDGRVTKNNMLDYI
jgi:2-oxoglutarate dehydrogenase E2 component (dihydrolipoamide succinyltransferase)